MKILDIQTTQTTPFVSFNSATGKLVMKGRLIPDDPAGFFGLLEDWLTIYLENPIEQTTLHLSFDYINTGGLKTLVKFLKRLEINHTRLTHVQVVWNLVNGDEYMLEIAQDVKTVVEIPVEIVTQNSEEV
jgi:hypothetical protein